MLLSKPRFRMETENGTMELVVTSLDIFEGNGMRIRKSS